MKESVSFRSSFNGFNREDVVSYISGLMDRISEGEQELEQKEQQLAEMEESVSVMRSSSDSWNQERENWMTRCSSLEEECNILKTRSGEFEEQRAAWDKERAELRAKIEELESRVADEGVHSKSNEEKLGAAMMEAKRFSEMLIKEANDRAGTVYRIASSSVQESTESIVALKAQMTALADNFTKTMGGVLTQMNGLIDGMTSFREDAKDNGAKFQYQSEFTGGGD